MTKVTIHTYGRQWEGAEIVGVGKDTLIDERDVLIVSHPDFEYAVDFYVEPDAQGHHYSVGNRAFWVIVLGNWRRAV